ncbi:hypothetical protein IKE82_00620 [Candidatus Saccharibacteria bacterium]|nr:hypothetical protein [Candidatus Saccharibacteria bacterium]
MPENNTNKKLLYVLIGLGLFIVGLVIAIVVVKINSQNSESEYSTVEEDEPVEEWAKEDDEIVSQFEAMREEVLTLLEEDPVNVTKINELYDEAKSMVLTKNRKDYIVTLTNERNSFLLSKGLKNEALDALTKGDYSMLLGPDQYRIYAKIIEQAEELGNTEVATRYRELQSEVADEYEADYKATEDALKDYEAQEMAEIEAMEAEEEE